jgi:hypothetical protein
LRHPFRKLANTGLKQAIFGGQWTKMNDPIKHHYNPQFYLRRWAGADGRLFRFHRPHIETVVSSISPEHTGFEDYLYTLKKSDDPQVLEKSFFSRVDSDAAPLLERFLHLGPGRLAILSPSELTDQERSDWARFLNSLQHRGPHSLDEIRSILDQNARNAIEVRGAEKTDEEPITYERFRELIGSEHDDAAKLILPKLIDDEIIGQATVAMTWAVLDVTSASHSLLTSDRPYIRTLGLLDPSCLVHVPISPSRMFLAANDVGQLEMAAAVSTSECVRRANDLVVRRAVRNVYGNNRHHLILRG